jgi:hypothetical protein
MNHAGAASRVVAAKREPVRPYHSLSPALFDEWLDGRLQCTAGRRGFKLGRYLVTRFRNGADFAEGLSQFRREVAAHRKVGFLTLHVYDESRCSCVEDELQLLGGAMQEAGLAAGAAEVIDGETVAIPIEVTCPVTGVPSTYEFFSVAFCRHADDPSDRLYDPSLSAPFTAINTTSDAFAFAMLVRDQSIRTWDCAPHAIANRMNVELLFRKCATVWQNMSISTIQSYGRVALDPRRRVRLSEDRTRWIAPHNDPVFAETSKCPFAHEMPVVYAKRLCEKWLATIFEGIEQSASRDGQSGGTSLLPTEGAPDELYQF